MSISDGNEGFGCWVRWQVPVCALIIALPAVLAMRFIRRLKAEPPNSNDLWTPCWRNLNPLWLLIYRTAAFLCLAWLLYQMVASAGAFAFYFYTQWTFALVMVYFALGTIVSAYGCQLSAEKPASEKVKGTGNLKSHHPQEEIRQKLRFWGYLMQTTYLTCAGAVMLTDLVFWCILLPFLLGEQFSLTLVSPSLKDLPKGRLDSTVKNLPLPFVVYAQVFSSSDLDVIVDYLSLPDDAECILVWVVHTLLGTWWELVACVHGTMGYLSSFLLKIFDRSLIGCLHSLNAVFLLLDAALNNLPFPWFGFAYFVLWSCLYVSFHWVLHACGFTWWPYPFLELRTPWAPVWYVCLALVHVPCYAIYAVLIKMKHSVLPGLFPRAFVLRSH